MFMQYSEYGVLSRLQVVFHLSCSDEEIYVTYRRTSSHLNDTRINLRWSTPVNFVSVVCVNDSIDCRTVRVGVLRSSLLGVLLGHYFTYLIVRPQLPPFVFLTSSMDLELDCQQMFCRWYTARKSSPRRRIRCCRPLTPRGCSTQKRCS
jgi:hypothetical protein